MTSPRDTLSTTVLKMVLVIAFVTILFYGKGLLLPLTVAGMLAMLLNPVDNWLRKKGLGRNVSITLSVVLLLLIFGILCFAVGQQGIRFYDNWGAIKETLLGLINDGLSYIGLDREVDSLNPEQLAKGSGTTGSITSALGATVGVIGDFFLVLVYVILFLAAKERIKTFFLRRTPDGARALTKQTIDEALDIAQKYLRGRLILIGILTVLYSVGFTIIGMDYAILIAFLTSVLSVIPYLGNIIGGILAIALSLTSGATGSNTILGIVATISVAQVLESYILMPLIVGDEVDLNPLTTVVAVIAFSIVWGAVGAIVAIPIVAIIRIICSHVPSLKDYAYLLGQE